MSGRGYGPRAYLARFDDSDINLDCIGLRNALPVRALVKTESKINAVEVVGFCRQMTARPNQTPANAAHAWLSSGAGRWPTASSFRPRIVTGEAQRLEPFPIRRTRAVLQISLLPHVLFGKPVSTHRVKLEGMLFRDML